MWLAHSKDTNDDAADPYGDGCDEYRGHPAWCGHYDDDDFTSESMCCACGGGVEDAYSPTAQPAPSPGPTARPTGPTPAPTACVDDDSGGAAIDSYGDPCAEYMEFPSWCGGYDDGDFTSNEMCCACGGGDRTGAGGSSSQSYSSSSSVEIGEKKKIGNPTSEPTPKALPPISDPTQLPTRLAPSRAPSVQTFVPTAVLIPVPSALPNPTPSVVPNSEPTTKPAIVPVPEPTAAPKPDPTGAPTAVPFPVPTAVPTPSPSPGCEEGTMIYRLRMYDSGGDGWQSAVYSLQTSSSLAESNEGVVVTSGTLASGSEGSEWLCLADGCYDLTVGGGSADSEIEFEFLDEVRILNYVVLAIAS